MGVETVKIVNIRQASLYIKNGVKPLTVEFTDRLVFIFNKKEATPLFDKWCNYELV